MRRLFLLAIGLYVVLSAAHAMPAKAGGAAAEGEQCRDTIIRPVLMNDSLMIPYVYKVNKYHIIPPYGEVKVVNSFLKKILITPRYHLQNVKIYGSASPEGPWKWNVFLGNSRARALANYLFENAGLAENDVEITGLAEEWKGTVDSLITHPKFPYRDSIISIIRNTPGSRERKIRIKRIENGRIWHRLITELFPPLRNTRIIISYYELNSPVNGRLTGMATAPEIPQIELCPLPMPIYRPQRERFYAIKTNALFLAALCANIGFEAELWPKTSIDIPFWYSPYDIRKPDRKIRLLGIQPEFRYWLGKKAGKGFYLGAHGHIFGFNIALNDKARYQDPNRALWGAGLGAGFAWSFGKNGHFYLDCGMGAGYANIVYDKYRNWPLGPVVSPKFESHLKKNYWGVTRLNLSVGYKWYRARKSSRK